MRINIVGVTNDRRIKDFHVSQADELAKIANAGLYERLFFAYAAGLVVERLVRGKRCYVRLHLDSQPFFDTSVSKDNCFNEVCQLCAGIAFSLPQLVKGCELPDHKQLTRNYEARLPEVTRLDWIIFSSQEGKADTSQTASNDSTGAQDTGAAVATIDADKGAKTGKTSKQAGRAKKTNKADVSASRQANSDLDDFIRRDPFLHGFKPGKTARKRKAAKAA